MTHNLLSEHQPRDLHLPSQGTVPPPTSWPSEHGHNSNLGERAQESGASIEYVPGSAKRSPLQSRLSPVQKVATSVLRATIMEFSHNHRFSSRALPRAPLDRAGVVTRPPPTTTRSTAHRGATRRRVATRTATAPPTSALRSEFQPRRVSQSHAFTITHFTNTQHPTHDFNLLPLSKQPRLTRYGTEE